MANNNGNRKKPARILEFRARNTKVIKAVDIYPDGKDIVNITGRNRQGKSTILEAIWMALGGKDHIPDVPIRQGEKRAEIFIDLGDFTVTRKITPGSEGLEVRGKDGISVPSPQKFLNSCLLGMAHNPLEFMRMKPADQVESLQKMLNIQLDRAKLEDIAGIWTRTIKSEDPIRLLDQSVDGLFKERTEVNREVKRLQGAIETIKIPKDKEDLKVIPVTDLIKERQELDKQKLANDEARRAADELKRKSEEAGKAVLAKDKEIAELEARLVTARKERSESIAELNRLQDEYFAKADEVDALVDPVFVEIDAKIARIDADNKEAAEIERLRQELKKSQDLLVKSQKDSERLTGQIKAVEAYKLDLIEKAGMPLPGLTIKDGAVLYHDLPISQASGREQIEISCAICLAQHPQIGIITIDVGWSELDESGKAAIREFAQRTGAQIWVTQVREEPGQEGFHIVDGELVAVDGQALVEDVEDEIEIGGGSGDHLTYDNVHDVASDPIPLF